MHTKGQDNSQWHTFKLMFRFSFVSNVPADELSADLCIHVHWSQYEIILLLSHHCTFLVATVQFISPICFVYPRLDPVEPVSPLSVQHSPNICCNKYRSVWTGCFCLRLVQRVYSHGYRDKVWRIRMKKWLHFYSSIAWLGCLVKLPFERYNLLVHCRVTSDSSFPPLDRVFQQKNLVFNNMKQL